MESADTWSVRNRLSRGWIVVLPFIVDPASPAGLTLSRAGSGYWSWPAGGWVSVFDAGSCVRKLEPTPGVPGDDVCLVTIPDAARLEDVVIQVLALLADGQLATVRVDALGS